MTNPLAQDLGGVVLLPCPWCGHGLGSITVSEGSTFRWRKVDGCCTDGPEVRHDTMAEDQAAAEIDSTRRAIEAWNTRTHSDEIAGALRDAERLDWMDAHAERIGYALKLTESSTLSATAYISQHKSVRAFVDSAMQQGGGGGNHA